MTAPAGQATLPGAMPVSHVLPPVNPFLGLIASSLWPYAKQYYAYELDASPVPLGGGSAQVATQINSDSHFLAEVVTAVVTSIDNQTVVAAPVMTVQLQNTGDDQNWFQSAVWLTNFAGTAQLPFPLPFPRLLKASSVLTAVFTNFDTGNARTVRLTIHGFKIYGYEDNPQPA